MSAVDVYLQIVEDEFGRPILHYNGRRWGVLQEPHPRYNHSSYGSIIERRMTTLALDIRAVLIEPEPAKPKRKWSTHMGLRKPKGNNA